MAFGELSISGVLGSFGGTLRSIVMVIIFLFVTLVILGIIFWVFYFRRKWNLKVEFKIPRAIKDLRGQGELEECPVGGIVNSEWGKGAFNVKRGVCWVKRKGRRASAISPFDIGKFVQGNNTLTVVQVSADKYIPVLPESYLNLIDDTTGERAILLEIRANTTESRAWRTSFERESKATYSIINLLAQYATYFGIGIILFMNFVGFAILYTKVT